MSNPPQIFKMLTNDGCVFDVNLEVAQQMGLTKGWLQYRHEGDHPHTECDADAMLMDKVNASTFKLVLRWCEMALNLPKLSNEEAERLEKCRLLRNILNEVNATTSNLFELIIAADFLNIEDLLEAGTQLAADQLNKYTSVKDLLQLLNNGNDNEMDT